MLEAVLRVAACFSGSGETGFTQCHAATRGAEELQTDLTSVKDAESQGHEKMTGPCIIRFTKANTNDF